MRAVLGAARAGVFHRADRVGAAHAAHRHHVWAAQRRRDVVAQVLLVAIDDAQHRFAQRQAVGGVDRPVAQLDVEVPPDPGPRRALVPGAQGVDGRAVGAGGRGQLVHLDPVKAFQAGVGNRDEAGRVVAMPVRLVRAPKRGRAGGDGARDRGRRLLARGGAGDRISDAEHQQATAPGEGLFLPRHRVFTAGFAPLHRDPHGPVFLDEGRGVEIGLGDRDGPGQQPFVERQGGMKREARGPLAAGAGQLDHQHGLDRVHVAAHFDGAALRLQGAGPLGVPQRQARVGVLQLARGLDLQPANGHARPGQDRLDALALIGHIGAAQLERQRALVIGVHHRAQQAVAQEGPLFPARGQLLPHQILPGQEPRPIDRHLGRRCGGGGGGGRGGAGGGRSAGQQQQGKKLRRAARDPRPAGKRHHRSPAYQPTASGVNSLGHICPMGRHAAAQPSWRESVSVFMSGSGQRERVRVRVR